MKHSLLSMCMLAGMAAPCQTAMAIGGQKLATLMQQQQIEVKGTVVDNTGEPLIGVSVQIVGKQGGVVTDIDGNFAIKAERGQQLKFSYIGFTDQIQKVNGPTMNVTMGEDKQTLQEVVVVGYGVQKKESLTGAVTVTAQQVALCSSPPRKARKANCKSTIQVVQP